MSTPCRLGLITGSTPIAAEPFGLEPVEVDVPSSDGAAAGARCSVTVLLGDGLAVLARHGHDVHVPAHEIDHAANMRALLAVGVDRVVALGSSGSLRADWSVGTVVAPDDLFAPWCNPIWFHDPRSHISPRFDTDWRRRVIDAWSSATDVPVVDGGTYLQTRGPRFETRAEIRFYATVADLVGMTVVDEALLAQQASLPYAAICPIDNIGNGLVDDPLTLESFRAGVANNAKHLNRSVETVIRLLRSEDSDHEPATRSRVSNSPTLTDPQPI